MNAGLYLGISLIAVSLPFIVSVFVAIQPGVRPKGIKDYFLYGRKLEPSGFLDTSVGYSFQATSIFLFFYWTFAYGISSLFVPFAWAIGYLLMYIAVKTGKLDDFLGSSEDNPASQVITIHGYAASRLKPSRATSVLVFLLAVATILGLGGTLVAEIDYALSFILPALGLAGTESSRFIETASQIAVLLFTGCYVLWGGYKAVVKTDIIQVPLAYVTIGAVLFVVAWNAISAGHASNGLLIAIAASVLFGVFFLSRLLLVYRPAVSSENDRQKTQDARKNLATAGLVFWPLVTVGLVVALVALINIGKAEQTFLPITKANVNWWGFGVIGVIALAVTNAIWQFIDISSLQRLQSLDYGGDQAQVPESARQSVCKGLLAAGIEASGVWVLVIALALAFQAAGVLSYEDLPAFFAEREGFQVLLGPIFIFAVVIFMISTVDGFISAMAYVTFYDLLRRRSGNEDSGNSHSLGLARKTTLLMLFFIYGGYHLLKASLPDEGLIEVVLYAIYAIQVSIAPPVLAAFFYPRCSTAVAGILSVAAGCVTAVLTAVSEPILRIPADSWYVIPPLATLLVSFATFFLVVGLQALIQMLTRGRTP